MDYSLTYFGILILTGLLAGVINTLAGGGSNLTLPALMLTGMPADVANATNRVGVFLQCVVGVRGYSHHGKVQTDDVAWVLVPNIIGGVIGAQFGTMIGAKLKAEQLRILLALMVLLVCAKLAFDLIVEPAELFSLGVAGGH